MAVLGTIAAANPRGECLSTSPSWYRSEVGPYRSAIEEVVHRLTDILTRGELYDLHVLPEAGVAHLQLSGSRAPSNPCPSKISRSNGEGEGWPPTAPGRARRKIVNQAVANRLGGHVTLTYEVVPHDPVGEVRRFVKRCRRDVGSFHWILVTQEGSNGRIHHHLLVPEKVTDEVINEQWGGRGNVQVVRAYDVEGIRIKAFYLAKDFDRLDRPTKHRYNASRGMGLRREVREWLTVDDVAEALSEYVEASGSDLSVREGPDALRAALVTWNPYN